MMNLEWTLSDPVDMSSGKVHGRLVAVALMQYVISEANKLLSEVCTAHSHMYTRHYKPLSLYLAQKFTQVMLIDLTLTAR
jgi:hypothetical protein